MLTALALVVAAYLLGSVASAVLVSRLLDLPDPRRAGSGNPGATNVLRLGGKKAAALTLAGDVLKGAVPVLAARSLHQPDTVTAAVGVAAFLGHLYPVFFRLAGGKGVATALGVLAASSAALGAALALSWLAVAAITRYSSLAAVLSALAAPAYAAWLSPDPIYVMSTTFIALVLIWRHRGNLRRLVAGREDRIGAPKT